MYWLQTLYLYAREPMTYLGGLGPRSKAFFANRYINLDVSASKSVQDVGAEGPMAGAPSVNYATDANSQSCVLRTRTQPFCTTAVTTHARAPTENFSPEKCR